MSDHIDGIKQAITHVEDVIGRYDSVIDDAEDFIGDQARQYANSLRWSMSLELAQLYADLAQAEKQEGK